mgnify:CR=1 FL=1
MKCNETKWNENEMKWKKGGEKKFRCYITFFDNRLKVESKRKEKRKKKNDELQQLHFLELCFLESLKKQNVKESLFFDSIYFFSLHYKRFIYNIKRLRSINQ